MTARLKTLPDALRGGAWPSPDWPGRRRLYRRKPVWFMYVSRLCGKRWDAMAYLAGLIAADGHLYSREVRIAFGDLWFLKNVSRIISCLGIRHKVGKGVRVYLVRIYSANLVGFLREKYCLKIGRKANALIFPSWLNRDEKITYTAGFFDGDGSIGLVKSGIKQGKWGPYISPRITFTSKSEVFLEDLRSFLESLGFRPRPVSREDKVYRLKMYGCLNLDMFLKILYPFIMNPRRILGAQAGANSCREVSG